MRTFLVFLIILVLGLPESNSVAEELFLVRVVSVDQKSGKISAEVIDGPGLSTNGTGNTDRQKSGESTGVHIDKSEKITVFTASGRLPERLHPGSVIRAWGDFSGGTKTLIAKKLVPGKKAGQGLDPTGVRMRLGKGLGIRGKGGARHGHGKK